MLSKHSDICVVVDKNLENLCGKARKFFHRKEGEKLWKTFGIFFIRNFGLLLIHGETACPQS